MIEAICRKAGITTERRNIPSIKKRNGKMGRGELVLKHVNLDGHRHLVLDVAVNHELGGDHLAEVSLKRALRDAQPSRILESTSAPRWTATGPDMLSNTPSCPASSPPAGASTASSCASSTSSPTAATPTGSGGIATMSPVRKPSSSAVGNIFGTRAPLSAKLRHGLSPNGFRSPSTPFAATAFPPTCRTTSLSRPPSPRQMSKILRPPSLVLVMLVGV
jgi:hypothetical protein